jgi:hypothetical protein
MMSVIACLSAMFALSFFITPQAHAANVYTTNYVIFYAQGDCHQEDCISAVYNVLSSLPGVVKIDASSLASHHVDGYRQVIASQGYNVISYVIHDTHIPHQDVIIPH